MADYHFVTEWRIEAPLDAVWEEISHPERWPTWWKGVERVETLEEGREDDGVGARHRYTWKSVLPYRLILDIRATRSERHVMIEGESSGELEGIGRWTFSHDHGVTIARFNWDVRTTKPWMKVIAPVARPVFAWNHDVIMRWGGESLARLLNVRLLGDASVNANRRGAFAPLAVAMLAVIVLGWRWGRSSPNRE